MAARPSAQIESSAEPLGHPPGKDFLEKKNDDHEGGARGELARACEAQRAHGRPSMHMREGSAVSRLIASRTLALASCTTSTPVWLWPDLVTSCGRELGRARFIQWCACWSPPPPRGGVGGSCPRIDASRAGEPGDMSRLPAGSSAATSVQAKRLLLACRACIRTERLMHRSDWRCRGCSCCQFSWAGGRACARGGSYRGNSGAWGRRR